MRINLSGKKFHHEDRTATLPNGTQYHEYFRPRRKKQAGAYRLSVDAKTTADFKIARENAAHRIAKMLGFATEFQTRDETFDSKFYIVSDDPQFCHQLSGNATLKKAVSTVFINGAISMDASRGRLTAHMPVNHYPLQQHMLAEMIGALHDMAQHAGGGTSIPNLGRVNLATQAKIAIWLFPIVLMLSIVGIFLAPYQVVDNGLAMMSVTYAIIPVLVGLVLIRQVFGQSSRGFSVLVSFLLAGIPATGIATYHTLYYVNTRYDASEASIHERRIINKYSKRNKDSTSYYVEIEGWEQGMKPYSIRINRMTYDYATPGGFVRLRTHPGHLGFEWIESFEVLK